MNVMTSVYVMLTINCSYLCSRTTCNLVEQCALPTITYYIHEDSLPNLLLSIRTCGVTNITDDSKTI